MESWSIGAMRPMVSAQHSITPTLQSSTPPLFHEEHLPGALDRAVEAALIMRRQAGVFARQNAALVSHELAQEIGVLEIERVGGKINFGFGTRRAHFSVRGAAVRAALIWFVGASFARHVCLGG